MLLGERNKTSVSIFSTISRETSFLSRQSSFKGPATAAAYSKTSEFSIDLINENKESILELQLINTICKQFRTFTSIQKKQFINKFLKNCKKEAINEINLFLEPLNHRDFCINAQKEYPAWVELDEKKRIIFSRHLESKKSKRPASNVKSTTGSAIKTPLRTPQKSMRTPTFSLFRQHSYLNLPLTSSAKSFATSKKSAARRTIGSRGTIGTIGGGNDVFNVVLPPDPPPKYSIENFINGKSSLILKKNFKLEDEIFKGRIVKNTDSVIEKLKFIFREHYESKLDESDRKQLNKFRASRRPSKQDKIKKDNNSQELLRKSVGKDVPRRLSQESIRKSSQDFTKKKESGLLRRSNTLKSSNTKSIMTSAIDEFEEDQQPVYLKKIKNNYYDRKLWDSLNLPTSNQLNYYPESEREYSTEFSILKRYDWTQSKFGKTLAQLKVIPAIPKSSESHDARSTIPDDSTIQDASWPDLENETKSREQRRQDFIIITDKFLKETKGWSNPRKITLLSSLLKYCPNFILLFVRDYVNEKINSKDKNINCLPDYILLQIFKLLDTQSLENSSNVCQRWNYLINTNEFWIYKCRSLGKKEKLFQVEKVIYDELQEDEDIDWRQAYSELVDFVTKLKSEYYKQLLSDFDKQLELENNNDELKQDIISNDRRTSSVLSIINSKGDSRRSSIALPVINDSRRNSINDPNASRRSSLTSELTESLNITRRRTQPYINFYALQKPKKKKKSILSEEKTKPSSRRSSVGSIRSRSKSRSDSVISITQKDPVVSFDPKLVKSLTEELSNLSENDIVSIKTPKKEISKTQEILPSDIQDKFEETKLDLKQSRDLLGKIMPNYRLRWKLEDEDDDDIKDPERILFNIKPINYVRNLRNHFESVTCMDHDKRRLITGSMDRSINVYDVRNGTFIRKLKGHQGGIRCLQLLVNRLCSGSWDCTIKIWNLINFQLVHTIFDSNGSFSCLDFDFKYLIAGSHDHKIRLWIFNEDYVESNYPPKETSPEEETNVLRFVRKIEHHKSAITSLKYDGIKTIISSNSTGSILLVDLEGNLLHELKHSSFIEPILCIKLVGALVLSTTKSGKLMFWNRFNNECEAVIQCHKTAVHSIAFYDGRFYTGGSDGYLKEWDLRTLTCLREIKCHEGAVNGIVVTDIKFITCGGDKLTRLFEMTTPIDRVPSEALQQ